LALKLIRILLMACGSFVILQSVQSLAQQNSTASVNVDAQSAPDHDEQHDFDFETGPWKVHVSRLQHPLTGSNAWVEYDGTLTVRKVWDGRANLAELEIEGQTGHLELLALRLYDPQVHQWSVNTSSSTVGRLSSPLFGEFKNGCGEFYDTEPFNGHSVLVRNMWTDITANSWHFEQAFSTDGGKTWEANWVEKATR
jgi:hypothetical protein